MVGESEVEDVRTLMRGEQYARLRTLLLGGPGMEIRIDPNKAPLLWDVASFLRRLEEVVGYRRLE